MSGRTAHRPAGAESLAALPEFTRLKRSIIETSGLAYYADKDALLAERIEARILRLGCGEDEYFRRVLRMDAKEELAALIDDITVGETYFFRNPQQFEALRDVILPDCAARSGRDGVLRIWSAGCASGAEPYSVSILFAQDCAALAAEMDCSILGTDINRKVLALARAGWFSHWDLRGMSPSRRQRCFTETDRGFQLDPAFMRRVTFEHQNLVRDIESFAQTHASLFDVILCRNVMIYFSADVMRRLIHGFRRCLVPGGWLLVGHAEPYFEIANILSPVAGLGPSIYRKLDGVASSASRERLLEAASRAPSIAPPDLSWHSSQSVPEMESPVPDIRPVAEIGQTQREQAPGDSALDEIRRLSDAGAWDQALAVCETALTDRPLDPAAYYAFALLSEHIGPSAAVEGALRRAIYLDRNFALAHYRLGCLKMRQGAMSPARHAMMNALTILERRGDRDIVPMGDGLTVGELRSLIHTHIGMGSAQ